MYSGMWLETKKIKRCGYCGIFILYLFCFQCALEAVVKGYFLSGKLKTVLNVLSPELSLAKTLDFLLTKYVFQYETELTGTVYTDSPILTHTHEGYVLVSTPLKGKNEVRPEIS